MDDGRMWSIMGTGLATVFTCLLSLILMIRVLRAILEGHERRHRTPPAQVPSATTGGQASRRATGELVAVIGAAIATASGLPLSSFRIKSVQASSTHTPEWGRIDRIPSAPPRNRR